MTKNTVLRWAGLSIMLGAALPGIVVGVMAYRGSIAIPVAHTIILWCVALCFIGWVVHMYHVFRLRKDRSKNQPES